MHLPPPALSANAPDEHPAVSTDASDDPVDATRASASGAYALDPFSLADAAEEGSPGSLAPAHTIDVDGIPRPTLNSQGKPLAQSFEHIQNFWRWFGNSQVVDEQGRPLVVYHGTPGYGFDTFSLEKTGERDRGDFGRGIYFTPSKNYASSFENPGYFNGPGDGTKTYSTYLKIETPLKYSARKGAPTYMSDEYDGVMIYNDKHELPFGHIGNLTETVAFTPAQIKSATGNCGTFEPANPSLIA